MSLHERQIWQPILCPRNFCVISLDDEYALYNIH